MNWIIRLTVTLLWVGLTPAFAQQPRLKMIMS
jgi:hypothetical protein